jgi:phenylacetate-coenzyme A ligase PaaK-like adenylate-forming protein
MERSPFYRQRLWGIEPRRCQPSDIPPLNKAEMMDHFDSLVTDRRIRREDVERFVAEPANLGKYFLGRYAVCHTSGSQGQPALLLGHRRHALLSVAVQVARASVLPNSLKAYIQRMIRPARLATVTQKPGFFPSGSTYAYLASARLRIIKHLQLSVFEPIEKLVARLNDFQPEHLSGYTGALESLAREQMAGRLQLRGCLQLITSHAEPLPESSRQFIESTFGVRVADFYSMAECLALTTGCLHFRGSHVNSDLALLEVVDEQYRPVPDGEAGAKVLVTDLCNTVQPMIRDEIGDVVTMSPTPCPCGSPLPLIQSIEGRTKERFWIEVNGAYRDLPYYLFLAPLHNYLDMAEHQVLQVGHNRFVVRAAPLPGKTLCPEKLRHLVMRSVRAEGLNDTLQVETEVVDMIAPDPKTGKNQRARNLVGPPPQAVQSPYHYDDKME